MQAALPEAVSLSTNGKLQVSQLTLLAATINAVKELDIKVQALPSFEDQSLTTKLAEFLSGIAERGEALVDRVQTKELCVEDVCVTRDQFLQMIQQSGAAQSTGGTPEEPVTPDQENQLLEEIPSGDAEAPVQEPAPEPVPEEVIPEPAPEPTPEPTP